MNATERNIEQCIKNMTLEEKVGQLLIGQAEGKIVQDDFRTFIQRYPIAGYRIAGQNIASLPQMSQFNAEIKKMYRDRGLPDPILGSDQEAGSLSVFGNLMTTFPGNMALGAAGDEMLCYQQGLIMGKELIEAGINLVFAPVVDVNIEKNNPVIGMRSFGDDPDLVTKMAGAMIDGFHDGGLACSLKHYPGHGCTKIDTHENLAVNDQSKEAVLGIEAKPFHELVASGAADTVMVSHVFYSKWQSEELPAVLSAEIIQDELRDHQGYTGVVLSDDMGMGAIMAHYSVGEAVFRFIMAGGDIALVNRSREDLIAAFDYLLETAESGRLSERRLNESVYRILAFKQNLRRYRQKRTEVTVDGAKTADAISKASLTLIRDPKQLLPIAKNKKTAVILPVQKNLTAADTTGGKHCRLAEFLNQSLMDIKVINLRLQEAPHDTESLLAQLEDYERVIIGTINGIRFPSHVALVNRICQEKPVIAVMLRDPYEAPLIAEEAALIAAYSACDVQMKNLAALLTKGV
ncbi:beta-N-acetylhexosaminidase [Scopulibacillus darangshiensis]|uniref:beta-N-acetylhexosaminidase n=1 Tax=Scopulibacillus darangshiensis TaxID=442528 RepID=A0A4R2NVL0_9BACL|nr:glycoside hydrolase family 3 protein [Scopulibacillus darangshiensis]TCP25987.1 beta-N-acetylhexosaminidase [Scopulibacillus darangshiensis]